MPHNTVTCGPLSPWLQTQPCQCAADLLHCCLQLPSRMFTPTTFPSFRMNSKPHHTASISSEANDSS